MTTQLWIVLDLAVSLLDVVAWFAAGIASALRRTRTARAALIAAAAVTLLRIATVAVLAGRGWWFVQEKVLLAVPMPVLAGAVAVLLAGRRLRAQRRGDGGGTADGVVPAFTAAFAALAGLVLTVVGGYPLTAGKALLAVAAVGAGALLTARAVSPAAAGGEGGGVVSRRRFLGWTGGATVLTAAGAGAGLSFLPAEGITTGGGPRRSSPASVSVADLRGPDAPAPGGTVRRYVVEARRASVRLPSGRGFDAWTYGGRVPGTALTATQGDLLEVRLRNTDVPDGVTLHWHGYEVPCGEDGAPGVTQRAVAPGEDFVYRFRTDQVGTYWYHTHFASHLGVRKGLYGTLVVAPRTGDGSPAEQVDLVLPLHTFDGTLVIGSPDGRADHRAEPGTSVRLRLVNTDSDPHRITLAGTAFRVVAVDGRDLHRPGEVAGVGLRLPAGGRYDVVFRMSRAPVALVVDGDRDGALHLLPSTRGEAPGPGRVGDTSGWPELDLLGYGAPAAVPFDPRHADRHFTMVLDRGVAMVDGRPAYAQTVNGRGHPGIPDQLVAAGDAVRLTVVNRSLVTHPWHLHGHRVLVLSRDGTPSAGSPLWVDTFDVRPGETWEVAFRATNPGIWMNHCHNLPHAAEGMMLRLDYDGVVTPFGDGHGGMAGHLH